MVNNNVNSVPPAGFPKNLPFEEEIQRKDAEIKVLGEIITKVEENLNKDLEKLDKSRIDKIPQGTEAYLKMVNDLFVLSLNKLALQKSQAEALLKDEIDVNKMEALLGKLQQTEEKITALTTVHNKFLTDQKILSSDDVKVGRQAGEQALIDVESSWVMIPKSPNPVGWQEYISSFFNWK